MSSCAFLCVSHAFPCIPLHSHASSFCLFICICAYASLCFLLHSYTFLCIPMGPGAEGAVFFGRLGKRDVAVKRTRSGTTAHEAKMLRLMTHALKNYARVSTRLWNNFVWNNFQGIISSRGRYTMMHVGTFKIMIPPVKIPRNNWVLEKKN